MSLAVVLTSLLSPSRHNLVPYQQHTMNPHLFSALNPSHAPLTERYYNRLGLEGSGVL